MHWFISIFFTAHICNTSTWCWLIEHKFTYDFAFYLTVFWFAFLFHMMNMWLKWELNRILNTILRNISPFRVNFRVKCSVTVSQLWITLIFTKRLSWLNISEEPKFGAILVNKRHIFLSSQQHASPWVFLTLSDNVNDKIWVIEIHSRYMRHHYMTECDHFCWGLYRKQHRLYFANNMRRHWLITHTFRFDSLWLNFVFFSYIYFIFFTVRLLYTVYLCWLTF